MPFWKKKPNPDKVQQQAFEAFENGDLETALKKLVQLREIRPTAEGLYYLGVIFDITEQKQESVKALEQAVELEPSHSQALYSLAMVHGSVGNMTEGLGAIERAYEADPNDFRILNLFAQMLLQVKGPALKRAVEISRQACELTSWEDEICLETYKQAKAAVGEDDTETSEEIDSNQPLGQTLAIIAHVERHVGRTANENALQNIIPISEVSVAVQTIEAATDDLPGLAFTTGMSHKPVHRDDGLGFEHAELCMFLPGSWRPGPDIDDRIWPWQYLQLLANRPHMDHEKYAREGYLRTPELVCLEDDPEPLGAGADFTAFLLLPDHAGSPPPFETAAGKTVHFLTAVPIYTDEYELAQREGADKLAQCLAASGMQPHFIPHRPSLVG